MSNFSFTKIDVPAAAGTYTYISVDGVDAAGEAVGNYGNVDGEGDGTFQGLIANPSVGVTFDPLGSTNTDVVGITSSGEIFGNYVDNVLKQYGFVDINGVATQISIPLANSTTVNGVNAAGLIYGEYVDFASKIHGFVDNSGSITQIDFPGANTSSVAGVNASGVIAGTYTDAQFVVHGFIDSNGSFKKIDPTGSIFTSVVGISDAGVVVGNYQDKANSQHGFVDANGIITTISIPGATTTSITAISATGEIVGNYADSGGNIHGFIDQGGVITSVDVPGATETNILGINASGEITGYYNDSGDTQHGFVGAPGPMTIESFGSTSLVQVGADYYLDGISSGTGPELQYQGAPVTAGQFGTETPIGAEQTSTGYDVAFKESGTGLYTVWTTDSSGNLMSSILTDVSGTNPALEFIETTFQQDLNGDGTIGLAGTVIKSSGSTDLVEVGKHYFLDNVTSGTSVELKRGGAAVTVGEYPGWVLIGAEQTSTGYDVALKLAGGDQYSVWTTDSNGNYVSKPLSHVPGNTTALEALETIFHQDLNGDGMIGIVKTLVHTNGSTSLVEAGNIYELDNTTTGTGPELQSGGAPVTVGEYAGWTLIGAVQTATGYDVALKSTTGNEYTVWTTDSSGDYLSKIVSQVPGHNATLESLESVFGQDLNGDGTTGVPTTVDADRRLDQTGRGREISIISTMSAAAPAPNWCATVRPSRSANMPAGR